MRNKNDLLRWADVIRTQAEEGGNTADLVGGLLKEIINYIGESGQAVSPDIEDTIREAVSSALSSIISSGDGVIVVNGGGTSGGEESGGEDYSRILLTGNGTAEYQNPYFKHTLNSRRVVIAKAGGLSSITQPIPVQPGDIIRYTGRVAAGFPAVVGFKSIEYVNNPGSANDSPYAYLSNPKVYLGDLSDNTWSKTISGSRFWDKEIVIEESDNVDYIMCCGWKNNRSGAPLMEVYKNRKLHEPASLTSLSYPTKTYLPKGKKILVNGASFSHDYDWIQLVKNITGIEVKDDAYGGSLIQGSLAARLMYRKIQRSGHEDIDIPHGLVFSEITVNNGVPNVEDTYGDYGVIVINHVYNNDVFNIKKRGANGNIDPSQFTADQYEDYFKVAFFDKNGNAIDTTADSFITNLNDKSKTSFWKVVPRGIVKNGIDSTDDTLEMTPAEAFDYCIKRIKSWNNKVTTYNDIEEGAADSEKTRYPTYDLQIVLTSHWSPGRPKYNETSRQLAVKHNLCYCELDKALGFAKGDDVELSAGKLYSSNSTPTIAAGTYNKSVLYSKDVDDSGEQVNGKDYWGRHLKGRSASNNYHAGKFDDNGKERYTTWPQLAWAQAIVDCLGLGGKAGADEVDDSGDTGITGEGNADAQKTVTFVDESTLANAGIWFDNGAGGKCADPYIAQAGYLVSDTKPHYYPYAVIQKGTNGASCCTDPIEVKVGDIITYTGWVAPHCPAIVGINRIKYTGKTDSDDPTKSTHYAYIYGPELPGEEVATGDNRPKLLLGSWESKRAVYQTDEFGEYVLDEFGNKIKVSDAEYEASDLSLINNKDTVGEISGAQASIANSVGRQVGTVVDGQEVLATDMSHFTNVEVKINFNGYVICAGFGAGRNGAPAMVVKRTRKGSNTEQAGALSVRRKSGDKSFYVAPDGSVSIWYNGEFVSLQTILNKLEESAVTLSEAAEVDYEPVVTPEEYVEIPEEPEDYYYSEIGDFDPLPQE